MKPYGVDEGLIAANYAWNPVLYKIIITMIACFVVAFLSSYLAERERKTKRELSALEDHVKRVEKIAAIGEMAASLAHEIKNPLASLSGSIQLIKDDIGDDPEHEKLMRIISREADRLNNLISSFLLFARPPSGKPEAIQLSNALAETIELFKQDGACRERIEIRKELIDNCWVEMDSGHLRQIAWNLLLNAADAIDCKGEVGVKMHPVKNSYVSVSVSDNGCGIPNEVMKSIFDPFFTTKPKGSGLGLSIVYSLIETYGGRLTVDSRINEGAIFTFSLKALDTPDQKSEI
ncbi:MAG: nitrogen regulation protein NR(II) [Nitrospinales bacterium]